jgi:hypothetical protein
VTISLYRHLDPVNIVPESCRRLTHLRELHDSMYISHMRFSPSHSETRYQVICETRFYETYAIYAVSPECNTDNNTTPTPMLPIPLLGERPDLLQSKPGLPHPFPPEILDLFVQMSEQDLSP